MGALPPVLLVQAPYLLTLSLLRRKTLRKGLALALGTSAVVLVALALLGLYLIDRGEVGTSLLWPSISALVQAGLLLAAVKTYRALPHEPGRGRTRWIWFLAPGAYMLLLLLPNLFPSHPRDYMLPSAAVANLRAFASAAEVYRYTYKNGYPASLEVMAPGEIENCNSASLVDSVLASGQKHRYIFTYQPGPPIPNPPEGCVPGVQSFRLHARPSEYRGTTQRSFVMD